MIYFFVLPSIRPSVAPWRGRGDTTPPAGFMVDVLSGKMISFVYDYYLVASAHQNGLRPSLCPSY